MARFAGMIGYGFSEESPPDSSKWVTRITERPCQGNIIRNTSQNQSGEKVNEDVVLSNSVSIIADEFAIEHFSNIKYVKWDGGFWVVSTIDATQRPRLILNLGGVYNGPKA